MEERMPRIAGTVLITIMTLLAFSAADLLAENRVPTPEEFKEMVRQHNESGKSIAPQPARQVPKAVEQFNRALALHTKKGASAHELKEAATLYQAASEAGLSQAATNLALLYLEGKGVKKDVKKALSLLHSASAKNDAQADIALARLYLTGTDVKKDEKKGESLLTKAAKGGNQNAVKMLAEYREWKKKNEKAMKEYQDIMKQLQAQQNKQRTIPPLQLMPPQSPATIPYPVIPGYEYVSGKRPSMPNFIAPSPQLPPQALNVLPPGTTAPGTLQPLTIIPPGTAATAAPKSEPGIPVALKPSPQPQTQPAAKPV
jgi:hypothetical protein